MPSVDTEFTRSVARRSVGRHKPISDYTADHKNTHPERSAASSASRTLVTADQPMVPFPSPSKQRHEHQPRDPLPHPTFPLDKGEEFRFTFTHMRRKLYDLEEWRRTVRGILNESRQQFKPLVDCGKVWMMMHSNASAKAGASLAAKDKDIEDSSTETDLSTSSCDTRVAKKRCRARCSSVGTPLSSSWNPEVETSSVERRSLREACYTRRRTRSLINYAPKVRFAIAEDVIWRVEDTPKCVDDVIFEKTTGNSFRLPQTRRKRYPPAGYDGCSPVSILLSTRFFCFFFWLRQTSDQNCQ
jgi:hypothetical protein